MTTDDDPNVALLAAQAEIARLRAERDEYYGMLVRLWNNPKVLALLDYETLRDFDKLVLREEN